MSVSKTGKRAQRTWVYNYNTDRFIPCSAVSLELHGAGSRVPARRARELLVGHESGKGRETKVLQKVGWNTPSNNE